MLGALHERYVLPAFTVRMADQAGVAVVAPFSMRRIEGIDQQGLCILLRQKGAGRHSHRSCPNDCDIINLIFYHIQSAPLFVEFESMTRWYARFG